MATIDPSEWHNTGSNGKASAVWVRKSGTLTAEIRVMSYRVMATLYVGKEIDRDYEGIPFPKLSDAQTWAVSLMLRMHARGIGIEV